ncbi:MAG: GNAT family N-acetyltransferase [Chloroflexi bacterium]|nr:GNAT family N-acetyltransferase [Chloroflexota bacterium]
MNIREATEGDLPRLMELYFQLSQLGETPEKEPHEPTMAECEALQELRSDPCSTCFVIEVDGRIEGSCTLYVLPNLSHGGRPFAIVENVVVDEGSRGSGCGQLLMQHAEARARAAGCYKVALTSNRRRANAHRFYQRLGFAPTHHGFTKYFSK